MSLRARLLVAVGVVALVALVAADVATYSSLRSSLINQVDRGLQTAHQPIAAALEGRAGRPGPGGGGPDGGGQGPGRPGPAGGFGSPGPNLLQVAPGTFVEVRTASGTVSAVQPAFERGGRQAEPQLPDRITGYSRSADPTGEPTVYFDAPATGSGGPTFRVRASRLADGSVLVLALPLTDQDSTLHHLLLIELAVTAGALALAGLVGWWLVRLGLRPLAAIEETAGDIAAGRLGRRVPGESGRTEVGRLARALNVMLGRIQDAFAARDATEAELRRSEARLRQFVADASHELRTPAAAVSAYAELFERGADRRPEDLARVMSGIRGEAARMGHLVEDLLLLARMDEGRPLERLPVELVGVAAEAAEASLAVGPDWPVTVEASRPVEVLGDRARLRQVVDNLLSNVRSHTPPGTSATVRIARDGADAVLRVEDNGPGISAEEAGRLFERFYRADPSRSRASGGAGLGLSIVAALVAAHGGAVRAAPRPGGGCLITVTLPATGSQ